VDTRKVIVSTVVTEGGNSSQRITIRCDLDERTGTGAPFAHRFFGPAYIERRFLFHNRQRLARAGLRSVSRGMNLLRMR
jgi:hypothetical protein